MTDSKQYQIRGAEVTITASAYSASINLSITIDLSQLDAHLPDHSSFQLIGFVRLPNYRTGQSYWWAKLHRKITVHTGSQAQRVVRHALAQIDDAIFAALNARAAREAELKAILSA